MKKILNFFNISEHIKVFLLKRKLKKYTTKSNKKGILKIIINILLISTIISGIVYVNYVFNNNNTKIGTLVLLGIFIIFYLIKKILQKIKKQIKIMEVSKLTLIDEDDKAIKTWDLTGYSSQLIGKKNKNNEVDIDLSEAIYATLVSREHAIMNKTPAGWYFEDIGSSNGSGIMSVKNMEKFKTEEGKVYKLESGDIIYIANTKILVE